MGRTKQYFTHLFPILVILLALPVMTQQNATKPENHEFFTCVLNTKGHHPKSVNLSTGFEFELVQKFAASIPAETQIMLGDGDVSYIEELKKDSLLIYITPYDKKLVEDDELICSSILADSCIWVSGEQNKKFIHAFNHWINIIEQNGYYSRLSKRFRPSYEPYKRLELDRKFEVISPYDSLIKFYCGKVGWDKSLLTALIWQESRFCIDAISTKGAEGLLQMLPSTAKRFHNDDMLDPKKNLDAGVKYINNLNNIFSRFATEEDLPKYILAAYSAGEGRLLDCIRWAKANNKPYSTWKDIVNIIEELREYENFSSDTLLQYGGLRGYETLNYVDNVYKLRDAFSTISREQSSQDQL